MLAFSYKPFLLYFTTNSLSLLGLWMQKVGVGWLTWQITESTFWTSFVTLALMVPAGILGPFFAVWAENWNMRKASIILKSAMFLISIFIYILQVFELHTVLSLAFLSVVYGVLSALYHPVRLVFVSVLIKKSLLSSAIGLSAASFNGSRVLGPAIAGFLIYYYDLGTAFLISALFYLPVILILFFLPLRDRKLSKKIEKSFFNKLIEGLRFALNNSFILKNLSLVFVNAFFIRGVLEIQPTIAGDLLSGSSTGLSIITTSAGIGALIGAIILGSGKYLKESLINFFKPMLVIGFLNCIIISLFPNLIILTISFLLIGFSTTLIGIGTQTLIQLNVEETYRARVLTWWSTISFGSLSLGGVFIGLCGEYIPLTMAMLMISIIGFLLSLYFSKFSF